MTARVKGTPAKARNSVNIPLPDEQMQAAVGKTPSAFAYLEVGRTMKEDIVLYTGIGPTASILDVGCGSGRIARHFVDLVQPPGRYVGMDVVKPFVGWCEENISPANRAFSFYHQDIYNGLYNPEGRHRASEYRFPFEDESFDLIFLASVFTHLLPEDALNYLKEIRRLLKPDGRCFSTWVLLGHDMEMSYMGAKTLEGKVGYGFRHCLEMLERCELTLAEEPVIKRWRGNKESPFRLQGLLLLERTAPVAHESLLSRYETPAAPEGGELEEARGTVQSFDPISNSVTLLVRRDVESFRLAGDTTIQANGQRADSSVFREGQRALIRYAENAENEKVAREVAVRDHPRPESVSGIIESIDLERGYITLNSDREFITFEFQPEQTQFRINRKAADASELREGQRASFQYIPRVLSINSRDLRRDPTTQPDADEEA